MEAIKFTYTRDPQEAAKWDLNMKFISSQDDIFYTARLFFHESKYFQTLFASGFKENQYSTLHLKVATSTLVKYFQILSGEGFDLTFTDEELVELIEVGDQHNLEPLIEYIIDLVVEREMISAEDLFRLVDDYNLKVNLEVNNLIHLEGIADQLDHLEEPTVWDCFDLVCSNLYLCKVCKREPMIDPEEYKRIALACYDRFPDKGEMFRDHTRKHLGCVNFSWTLDVRYQEDLTTKLREAGLFKKGWIVSFRNELEACLDIILNFKEEPEPTIAEILNF